MHKIYLSLVAIVTLLTPAKVQAQPACSLWPRYDQELFTSVDTIQNIVFGANTDYQGVNYTLKMDIYQPAGDTLSQRPLIIFAHGGSFVAGDKANSDQVDLCTHFARRGYVCVTMNYRLGIAFPINGATATDAVYRAAQDMKAAIRFMRKDAATVNSYKIDPSIIFIGGTSAGAFTALHTAYMNTYAELPATLDTAALGNLDGNSGNPGYSSDVNAVINLCGALGDAAWVVPGDVPLCSMHGTADATVPYGSQMLYLLGIVPIQVVDGSYAIHDYIRTFNHPATMYTWYGAPHVPYDGTSPANIAYLDTTLRFVSNFLYSYLGCSPTDPQPLANTVFTTTGVNTAVAHQPVLVRNPANELIKVQFEQGSVQEITLVDGLGRNILKRLLSTSNNQLDIASADLADGMYYLHYKGVKNQGIIKVLVVH